MNDICLPEHCTGCHACSNVCPSGCIEMHPLQNGHLYPVIDREHCTDCGLCRKICPIHTLVEKRLPLATFASYSKHNAEKAMSTSGGVASVFSSYIIRNGGVVYGCAVSPGLRVEHVRIDRYDQLYRLRGSKYVQSKIGTVYCQIKKDLQNHRQVLFIGTPCQVAGLNRCIKDKTGLLTIDLICHGVPSQFLFDKYVNEILRGRQASSVSFRSKEGYRLTLSDEKKILYDASFRKDLFLTGFLKNLYLRESCYSCLYASKERVSDITVGDFWGLGRLEKIPFPQDGKISVVLLNTSGGSDLFKACSSDLYSEKREYSEAVEGNLHLRCPSKKNNRYDLFLRRVESGKFVEAARRSLWFHMIKNKILLILGK